MQVFIGDLIQGWAYTGMFTNNVADTFKYVGTLGLITPGDATDPNLEIWVQMQHSVDCRLWIPESTERWTASRGALPTVEWRGTTRFMRLAICPNRPTNISADISQFS